MAKPAFKQFKVGDVVSLKSGGYPMTITRGTNHEGTVECGWFNHQGLCSDTVPAEALDVTKLRYDVGTGSIQ